MTAFRFQTSSKIFMKTWRALSADCKRVRSVRATGPFKNVLDTRIGSRMLAIKSKKNTVQALKLQVSKKNGIGIVERRYQEPGGFMMRRPIQGGYKKRRSWLSALIGC